MIDVKEIAKRLNISKKTVYKYFKKYDKELKSYITRGNKNQIILNEKGYKILMKLINKNDDDQNKQSEKNNHIENDDQNKKYIELLESQVMDLKKDKADLIKLLDQQQQLHLQLQTNILLQEKSDNKNKQDDVSLMKDEYINKENFFDKLKRIFE